MLSIEALEAFSSQLPRQARVLLSESNPEVQSWLEARGIAAQTLDPSKDLRLLRLGRESWDGIWAEKAFDRLSIEDAQRVVAIFFPALAPKKGVLYASHPYPESAFASMVRQNGFRTRLQASREGLTAVVAQRI